MKPFETFLKKKNLYFNNLFSFKEILLGTSLAFCFLFLCWWHVNSLFKAKTMGNIRTEIKDELVVYGHSLTIEINHQLSLLEGLVAFTQSKVVSPDSTINENEFNLFASGLYEGAKTIRNFSIAPQGIQKYVFPLEKNRTVVGHDLLNDSRPDVRADTQRAIDTGKVVLSEPYELRQSGLGLVMRKAVYQNGLFWGLVTMEMDLPPILNILTCEDNSKILSLALRDNKGNTFSGNPAVFHLHPEIFYIKMPEGEWVLGAVPKNSWDALLQKQVLAFQLATFMVVVLFTSILYLLFSRQFKLKLEVKNQIKKISEVNVLLAKDNAKRKSVEQELSKNLATLQSIFRAAPIGIGMVVDRVIIQVNDRMSEMTGYAADELLGKSARMLYPSDEEFELVGENKYKQIGEQGVGTVETRWLQKDGQVVDVLLSSSPLNPDDLSSGVTFTAVDISSRKKVKTALVESTKKYRSMMESMNDPVYICSQDFRVEYMNPAMIRRTGKNEIGEFCFKSIHGLDEKCSWCKTDRVQNGEYYELNIVSPKDNRSFHVSNSPISHSDGSVSKMTIFRDTTEITEMRTRLQQAQKMESIGTLAGGIAHDFNNILFPIIGYAEMLLEEVLEDHPFKSSIDEILSGALRARDLVKQILAFSRQANQEIVPFEIQLIIKEVIKLSKATLPSTIRVITDISNDCGKVLADPTQIHQVVMNLITNAFHAMEDSGGSLMLTLKEVDVFDGQFDLELADEEPASGRYVCLTVADTGKGMDAETVKRVFEPYFTTKDISKGTGLGLAVVHGIVKSCKGHIEVQSEPGHGTEFKIYLPITVSELEINGEQKPVTVPTGNERILLVDDEEAILTMLNHLLEQLGYKVNITTSGIEALDVFRATPDTFDLVITDLTMPDMTGDSLTVGIKKIRPDIPVILITGFGEKITKEKALQIGLSSVLMKPVIRADMANAIRAAVDHLAS